MMQIRQLANGLATTLAQEAAGRLAPGILDDNPYRKRG
jgi:hypothetical protein